MISVFRKKNMHFKYPDYALKGIAHPKMKILSSFTHPQVVPNLSNLVTHFSSFVFNRRHFRVNK